MKVKVLATCRKPELLPYTLLVFRTIRVGFPTANIKVYLNPMSAGEAATVKAACVGVGAQTDQVDTIHHEWIAKLVTIEDEPFFLCDTDIIFYSDFERFRFTGPLAGWRIPEWSDAFSGAVARARLHTSLLYINPVMVRERIEAYESGIANSPFTPKANLFYPLVVPFKKRSYFYDTCAMLYHAIGGESFTDEQVEAYFHFHFGSIPDFVIPRLPAVNQESMLKERQLILDNPALGRGKWREQMEYLQSHPVT